MTIHNNPTPHAATVSIPLGSGSPQIPSRINNKVEEVAFDVLLSQERNTEQLRFELKESGKTGSQYYTIATWKGKRYRITVHDNKRKLAYSEGDWQKVEAKTITVLDKVQNDKHFFKGSLQLHAKTAKKWTVTHENNTPHVDRSVNKKVIREFKNLLEKQINPTNILPATKSPKGLQRKASYPLNTLYRPVKKEGAFLESLKKTLKKFKEYFRPLKSNTNDQNIDTKEVKRSPLEQVKDYFFPLNNRIFVPPNEDFNDLSSVTSSTSSSFEYIENPTEAEGDDNTSLGGISIESSNVSNDSGSSYQIKR
ncbi:hypothetical protein [Candidatus Rhabdochlamydia sp. T3358]|uniref:hypothetical protein n=1 Tax=Candidatus Rhabdochlamydia sp. T3358 TaxID=2099795 RepID=UPI0010B637D4|nr:hypothetical protein [Candidatus Rhabdochlamydia sp. T3358]VHO04026.1 hypothetical protein RHT_01185 [Candidatus Rhabdochlamydia sp. T3358]